MKQFRAGIIGTGKHWSSGQATGTGISHEHARGYAKSDHIQLVALCDLNPESTAAFQELHGGDLIYQDYHQMLAEANLDVVSICTWPHLHEPMVIDACKAGIKAIHCEKPLAPTWAAAKRMVAAADEAGVQLTFNHQRRFDLPYMKMREFVASGAIGELKLIEAPTDNMFDWGTHWFDMARFLAGEPEAEWVLAAVDPTNGNKFFGVAMESSGIGWVRFQNGVQLVIPTGDPKMGFQIRVTGTEGRIELGATGWDTLRIWKRGDSDWVDLSEKPAEDIGPFARAFNDIANCLTTGSEPQLSARRALKATELLFSVYHSARTHRKVVLPLTEEDVAVFAEG